MLQVAVAIVAGLLVTLIANLCTTVYLHRTLSHRSLTVSKPVDVGFRCVLWLTTGLKAREWVAVHRKHHAFTDEPGDPHSPKLLGWKRVQLTNAALYRREARNEVTLTRYAKDLQPDMWDRVLFDHAFVGLGIGIAILILIFGVWLGLLAALVHAVSYLSSNAAVNSVGHTFGKRPYDNTGTNVLWVALITSGEGWHNNHHAAPTSARIGFGRHQVDFGWWLIRSLTAFKLAKVRLDRVVLVSAAKDKQAA